MDSRVPPPHIGDPPPTHASPGAIPDPAHDSPFEIVEPAAWTAPVVLDSPHSGQVYPASLLAASRLDPRSLRASEDAFVDGLALGAVARGAPLLRATFARAYVDLNREPLELDPRMFDGRLPAGANTRSLRVAAGLGVVPRVVGEGREIYGRRLPAAEALARVEAVHRPYYRALEGLLRRGLDGFGSVVLLDLHSMPSAAATGPARPEIVLGDRYGASAAPGVMDAVEAHFRARGYAVGRNRPYAGGHIVESLGAPSAGVHAVQVEVARALYMDERELRPNPGFPRLQADLAGLVDALAALPRGLLAPSARPLAAE